MSDWKVIDNYNNFELNRRYLINKSGDVFDTKRQKNKKKNRTHITLRDIHGNYKMFDIRKLMYWTFKEYVEITRHQNIIVNGPLHVDNIQIIEHQEHVLTRGRKLSSEVIKTIRDNINKLTMTELIAHVKDKHGEDTHIYMSTISNIKKRKTYHKDFEDIVFEKLPLKVDDIVKDVKNIVAKMIHENVDLFTLDILERELDYKYKRNYIRNAVANHCSEEVIRYNKKFIENCKYIYPIKYIDSISIDPNYYLDLRNNRIRIFSTKHMLCTYLVGNNDEKYKRIQYTLKDIDNKITVISKERIKKNIDKIKKESSTKYGRNKKKRK